tara:strand:+ start:284 stop:475 length:192 start_codon:yes stop_codon:yes gene_type:complete
MEMKYKQVGNNKYAYGHNPAYPTSKYWIGIKMSEEFGNKWEAVDVDNDKSYMNALWKQLEETA